MTSFFFFVCVFNDLCFFGSLFASATACHTGTYIIYCRGFNYNWDDAQQYCINTFGTDLASITNIDESNEATNLLNTWGNVRAWIGGRTVTPPTTGWYWSDGSTWSYTVWYTASEPNQISGPACAQYWEEHVGFWGDNICTDLYTAFFCNTC